MVRFTLRGKVLVHIFIHRFIHPGFPLKVGVFFMQVLMSHVLIVLLLNALLLRHGSAGPVDLRSDDDSTKVYRLDEIVVTAIRFPSGRESSPTRLDHRSAEQLENSNGTSLGTALGQTTGFVVRDYGSGASLQTISPRGLGAEHTLILLDGVPVNNVQTGITDLRLIPLDGITQIELMGGTVSISTVPTEQYPRTELELSSGSFHSSRVSLHSDIVPEDEITLSFGGASEGGAGDYPFDSRLYGLNGEAVRSNSDYRTQHGFVKGRWQSDHGMRAYLMLQAVSSERGSPGPIQSIENQGSARQADDQFQVTGQFQAAIGDRLDVSVASGFQNAYEHYSEFLGLFPADNYYRNVSTSILPSMKYTINQSLALLAGVDLSSTLANGNSVAERKTRLRRSLYVRSEIQAGALSFGGFTPSLFPAIRYTKDGEFARWWNPGLGVNIRSFPRDVGFAREVTFTIHSSLERDIRVPTFNELYYVGAGGAGNPTLGPEQSVSFDCGLQVGARVLGKHELDVTYYSVTMENRILWMPASSPSVWSPRNVGTTHSTGLETQDRWQFPPAFLELEANYSVLNARKTYRSSANDPEFNKQLIYVPLETADLNVSFQIPISQGLIRKAFFWLDDSFLGDRFATEDNSVVIPRHAVLNGNIGMTLDAFGALLRLRYEVNNALNTSYEIMPRYPMPLRNDNLSISILKTY